MDKPTLTQVRNAIAQVIRNAVPELWVYSTLDEVIELPAALIEPELADFEGAFSNGDHVWYFNIWVMVPRSEPSVTVGQLDSYVTGWGDKSIPKAIYDNDDLGLDVNALIYGMKAYGGQFQSAGVHHLGAVLLLRVHV